MRNLKKYPEVVLIHVKREKEIAHNIWILLSNLECASSQLIATTSCKVLWSGDCLLWWVVELFTAMYSWIVLQRKLRLPVALTINCDDVVAVFNHSLLLSMAIDNDSDVVVGHGWNLLMYLISLFRTEESSPDRVNGRWRQSSIEWLHPTQKHHAQRDLECGQHSPLLHQSPDACLPEKIMLLSEKDVILWMSEETPPTPHTLTH